MPRLQEEHAKVLVRKLGWFGPPALVWRGKTIDGRLRSAAAEQVGLEIPVQEVETRTDAARELILRGEHDRAKEMLGALLELGGVDLAVRLRLEPVQVAHLFGKKNEVRARARKRRQKATRQQALDNVSRLYVLAVEDGRRISPRDLEKALGQWLNPNASRRAAKTDGEDSSSPPGSLPTCLDESTEHEASSLDQPSSDES